MFRSVSFQEVVALFKKHIFLDLLVTIKSVGDLESIFVSKKNCFLYKRVVVVFDDTNFANVVFWGEMVRLKEKHFYIVFHL